MKMHLYILLVGFMLLLPAACKFSFKFDLSLKNENLSSSDKWTKLGARGDGYQVKLVNDSVFCLDELMNVNLRSVVDGAVIIVEIDKADCESYIEELLDILKEEKYKSAKEKKVVFIAGAYSPREALLLKREHEIPFDMYISNIHLRGYPYPAGPKLFVVDSVYAIRDKFIPNFDRKENIRLYLDQILCGEVRY